MKAEIKPIKRSKKLAPLSREHHDTLLFTWKIRQGIKFGAGSEAIAAYCFWYWQNHLKDHFKIEEQSLCKILPADHPMMMKMMDDHQAIEIKIKQLAEYPCSNGLERLAQIISYHVRFEERELFNHIEEVASDEQMDELYISLTEQPKECLPWKNEFWLRSK